MFGHALPVSNNSPILRRAGGKPVFTDQGKGILTNFFSSFEFSFMFFFDKFCNACQIIVNPEV